MKDSHIDMPILFTVLVLVGIGLIMVYSSSSFRSIREARTSLYFVKRQSLPLLIGMTLLLLLSKVNYHLYQKMAMPLMVVTIGVLIYVLLEGKEIHGVRRWISLGPFSFQPSEFAKLSTILYTATFISKNGLRLKSINTALPLLFVLGVVSLLLIKEPSLGVLSILLITVLAMLFMGRMRIPHLLLISTLGVLIIFLAVYKIPYAKTRFSAFLSGEGYQVKQSILGIGSGGIFGVGLGNGREKLLFLPAPHTDFIFAIIAEELGFIGCFTLFFLYTFLFIRGIKLSIRTEDPYGMLLGCAISFTIFISFLVHTGVASGLLPTTGLPLPFVSFGGSSLIINLSCIGILLNISKHKNHRI
jgi:cell division protein FtsW